MATNICLLACLGTNYIALHSILLSNPYPPRKIGAQEQWNAPANLKNGVSLHCFSPRAANTLVTPPKHYSTCASCWPCAHFRASICNIYFVILSALIVKSTVRFYLPDNTSSTAWKLQAFCIPWNSSSPLPHREPYLRKNRKVDIGITDTSP